MKLTELFVLFDTVVTKPGDGLCDLIAIDNVKLPCGGIQCKNCPLELCPDLIRGMTDEAD